MSEPRSTEPLSAAAWVLTPEAERQMRRDAERGGPVTPGDVIALLATLDATRETPAGLRARIEAALQPTCHGDDICEVHGEMMFDGRCEDYERDALAAVRAALGEKP